MTIGTPLWDEFVANLKEVNRITHYDNRNTLMG